MVSKTNYPPVSVWDVTKEMGKALRPDAWLSVLTLSLLFAASVANVFVPLLYKRFFDVLGAGANASSRTVLVSVIVEVLLIHLFTWASRNAGLFGVQKIEPDTMARLRQNSFEYLVRHSFSFFTNTFTGSLIQRVGRFARAFERIADTVAFNFVPLAVTTVGAVFITYTIEHVLSYVILAWVVVFFTLNYFFAIWRVQYNIKVAEADSKTTGTLADILSNQNSVSLFTAFPHERQYFREVTGEQSRMTKVAWNINSSFDAVQSAVTLFAEFFVFYFGIGLWQNGAMTIGTFVLVQVYIIQLADQLWDFGRIIRTVYEVYADSKEMVEILKLPHEVQDAPTAVPLSVVRGDIVFDDVTFNYQETRSVLNGISLTIPGGQKVAVVGPSGAGKTTFVRLILRFYDLTSGRILIDGQDIAHATQESLRKNIALVPQDPILFHRSLLENVRYGRLDASDEDVKRAATLAHCDDFIDVLPFGYETYVGERGIKLSGGERQRIAIARAILKNAPILILDEATSSLDSHSETLIQDALETLMKGKTAIVVAHRLSTIRKMDRIVVLERGEVKEDGTHEELLENPDSLYRDLWKLQAGGFIAGER